MSIVPERTNKGKTHADVVSDILHNWKLLVVIIFLLIVCFSVVNYIAEPGSEVNLFGLKYMKAKMYSRISEAEDSHLLLPKEVRLVKNTDKNIPIIDGSIALSRINGGWSGVILGANIHKIRVGARMLDGTKAELIQRDGSRILFSSDMLVEIEYGKDCYAMTTKSLSNSGDIIVSLDKISHATLDHVSIDSLALGGSGGD